MSQHEDDRLLDHEYDGIREYDNPMPRWWLATLWGTVIFSVLYVLHVPGINGGPSRLVAYAADSARVAGTAAANDPLGSVTEAMLVAAAADPARLAAGQTTFTSVCAACHLADGGGSIGPNLTDHFSIHGDSPLDIFQTVANGVPARGMPTWSASLPPDQVIAVAAYVITLRGTTPAVAKAPEGVPDSSTAGP